MKKISLVIVVMLIIACFPLTVGADMGPKPSIVVTFENTGDELCYGTLLSKIDRSGPHQVWSGDEDDIQYENTEIFLAFAEYKDNDGFYFLQTLWNVSEKGEIAWEYYPPDIFKILLYYPESDVFVISDIYESYAFDSYYTVDMSGLNIESVDTIKAEREYQYVEEIISLVARIVITIAIEIAVAYAFGFDKKPQLLLLTVVNTVTQIALNITLNIINYTMGYYDFIGWYAILELAVFALEALIYCIIMNMLTDKPRKHSFYIIYALIANLASFWSGMLAALILPAIL